MTPLAAGGVPPYGADFHGILFFLSAAARWEQAGGNYSYDSAFATALGGYPQYGGRYRVLAQRSGEQHFEPRLGRSGMDSRISHRLGWNGDERSMRNCYCSGLGHVFR